MSTKSKIYSLTLIAVIFNAPMTLAKEESVRCVESKSALKGLEKKVFDTIHVKDSPFTLRDLEAKKIKLEAQKSILDTFANIHKQREDFSKRLNPTHPESFYSKSMNAKTAVQETQKQIISNYILSSITSSISAILEKDNFLKTTDEEVLNSPEWKAADSNYKKFKILSNGNPYEYMKTRCEELNLKDNASDPCTNFTDIKEKKILTLFMQTNQDMVGDVTNNFFDAYDTANNGEGNLDDKLKEIQKDKITDYVDIEKLNKERTILISSLLEKNESNGVFDTENLSNFFKVNSIDPQANKFSSNPMKSRSPSESPSHSLESITKVESDFEEAKKCFTKKAFGIDIACDEEKSISNFFSKINDLGFSKVSNAGDVESSLLKNDDVKKLNAHSLTSDLVEDKLKSLSMLNASEPGPQRFALMKKVCKNLAPTESAQYVQTLWDCLDDLNSNNKSNKNGIVEKKSEIDSKLSDLEKEISEQRAIANSKYGDIVKYAAATAKEYCKNTPSKYKSSCVGSESNITTLVFGNESFLTNLNNIEWNMSGRKESEDILASVNKKCSPLVAEGRQKSAANKQIKKDLDTTGDVTIKNVCVFASNDLKDLQTRTPSAKQVAFRKNFNTHYDRSTGKMAKTKKVGIGTMIAKSVGSSLVTNGLPLYLQNTSFKNNLPYQTNMAIYQKNYMYMMNNPQYWSTSMFSGYGVSSALNGYASSTSYYNFSN